MESLDATIKYLIKQKGISTKTFVKDIGMTETGFRQMLENESIKLTTLKVIAAYFDVPLSYLIGEDDKEETISNLRTEKEYWRQQAEGFQKALRVFNEALVQSGAAA